MEKLLVLAIGGNSLLADPDHKDINSQYDTCQKTCGYVFELIQAGYKVVLTHGNGPQVGFILRRAELALSELHSLPLDICVADTQGSIGYMLQKGMYHWSQKNKKALNVSTIVTQVLVDPKDKAFQDPRKPIGSFLDEKTALERKKNDGWDIVEDAGRGYRRVVPSPKPLKIIELDAIKALLATDFLVIAAGGGGIPVFESESGGYQGVEAVIDKDHSSSLLANELDANYLVISTGVEKVSLHFGKKNQQDLDKITVKEAEQYIKEEHFSKGSMLPKVEAAVAFVKRGGEAAIITAPYRLKEALQGKTGTWIVA